MNDLSGTSLMRYSTIAGQLDSFPSTKHFPEEYFVKTYKKYVKSQKMPTSQNIFLQKQLKIN